MTATPCDLNNHIFCTEPACECECHDEEGDE